MSFENPPDAKELQQEQMLSESAVQLQALRDRYEGKEQELDVVMKLGLDYVANGTPKETAQINPDAKVIYDVVGRIIKHYEDQDDIPQPQQILFDLILRLSPAQPGVVPAGLLPDLRDIASVLDDSTRSKSEIESTVQRVFIPTVSPIPGQGRGNILNSVVGVANGFIALAEIMRDPNKRRERVDAIRKKGAKALEPWAARIFHREADWINLGLLDELETSELNAAAGVEGQSEGESYWTDEKAVLPEEPPQEKLGIQEELGTIASETGVEMDEDTAAPEGAWRDENEREINHNKADDKQKQKHRLNFDFLKRKEKKKNHKSRRTGGLLGLGDRSKLPELAPRPKNRVNQLAMGCTGLLVVGGVVLWAGASNLNRFIEFGQRVLSIPDSLLKQLDVARGIPIPEPINPELAGEQQRAKTFFDRIKNGVDWQTSYFTDIDNPGNKDIVLLVKFYGPNWFKIFLQDTPIANRDVAISSLRNFLQDDPNKYLDNPGAVWQQLKKVYPNNRKLWELYRIKTNSNNYKEYDQWQRGDYSYPDYDAAQLGYLRVNDPGRYVKTIGTRPPQPAIRQVSPQTIEIVDRPVTGSQMEGKTGLTKAEARKRAREVGTTSQVRATSFNRAQQRRNNV